MRYLLDSNVVIAALNGAAPVLDRLGGVPSDDVCVSIVTLAELLFGAHRSTRRADNLRKIQRVKAAFRVLPLDEPVAELYGAIRADLQGRGISKSDFDLVIACTALGAGAVLVTHDRGLLDGSIEELRAEDWLASFP